MLRGLIGCGQLEIPTIILYPLVLRQPSFLARETLKSTQSNNFTALSSFKSTTQYPLDLWLSIRLQFRRSLRQILAIMAGKT